VSGDAVGEIFTTEGLASLPVAWQADAHGAFKQLCLSHKDELTFRRRARDWTLGTYLGFIIVLLLLNICAATGLVHIADGWVGVVRGSGVVSFLSLAAKALKEWIGPYMTKARA
jgi:hypothetical protein